jgi:hypothetical protein
LRKFVKYISIFAAGVSKFNPLLMIRRLKHLIVPLIIVVAGFSSCYPVDDLKIEDLDVAVTLYDKSYYVPGSGINKFGELVTFTVVDTIIHIVGTGAEDNMSRQHDAFIIEQVRLNMLKLGFVEELDPLVNPADVAITLTALSTEHEVYTWYPYWGWYWGYYPKKNTDAVATGSNKSAGSTYSYYYPWYPYSNYYTYQSASLLMEMVDVARINPDVEEIPVIWAGVVNGVLEQSMSATTQSRISKGIDQCFDQSPFLLKTDE